MICFFRSASGGAAGNAHASFFSSRDDAANMQTTAVLWMLGVVLLIPLLGDPQDHGRVGY